MNISKGFGVLAVAGIIAICGSGLGKQITIPVIDSLIPTAEARLGRPLTPVSVAGVGRRTVRRCAVGVYHC